MKRIYIFLSLLTVLLTLCMLTSCGIIIKTERVKGDQPKASMPERATEPPVTTRAVERYIPLQTDAVKNPQAQLLTLPATDFRKLFYSDTEVYFMIGSIDGRSAVSVPEDHILFSTVKTAKNEIGKKFNAQIVDITRTEKTLFEDLAKDSYFCDLLALAPDIALRVIEEGYAVPLHQIPFLSDDSVYVQKTQTGVGQFSENGLLTDASYLASDVYCLYFDLTRVDPGKIPYAQVLEGKWDWRAFSDLVGNMGLKIGCKTDADAIMRALRASGIEDADILPYLCLPEETPDIVIDKTGNFDRYLKDGNRFGMMPLPGGVDYVDREDVSFFVCPKKTITLESAGLVMSALGASFCGREAPALSAQIAPWVHDNGTTLMLDHLIGGTLVSDFSAYLPAEESPAENPSKK